MSEEENEKKRLTLHGNLVASRRWNLLSTQLCSCQFNQYTQSHPSLFNRYPEVCSPMCTIAQR